MKWARLGFIIGKTTFVYVVIYLLFTTFNTRNVTDTTQLVITQLLYPFPMSADEQVDFVKVIMVLGLAFTSFSNLFLLMSELSEGGKELIRFHSKNRLDYILKVGRTILPYYVVEFIIQLLGIVAISLAIPTISLIPTSLLYLVLVWFLVDSGCFLLCQVCSPSSLVVIMCLTISCLLRYLLMEQCIWFVSILLFVIGIGCYKKEK